MVEFKLGKWYENRNKVLTFAYILYELDELEDVGHTIYYFEKPWKREFEYKLWTHLDKPTVDMEEHSLWDAFDRIVNHPITSQMTIERKNKTYKDWISILESTKSKADSEEAKKNIENTIDWIKTEYL